MGSSYVPPVNLHSPGAIGDVTPSTVASTVNTSNAVNDGAKIVITGLPGSETTTASFHCGVTPTNGNYFLMAQPGDFVRLNGAGNVPVQITVQLAAVCYFTLTAVTVQPGIDFVLGNAATTGLTPGVLAATTNATIEIKDANGQAYRVPCII